LLLSVQDIFPNLHAFVPLPGKNSRFALKQFARRPLHVGGRVPRKNIKSRLRTKMRHG
jgi:hypothetical protein